VSSHLRVSDEQRDRAAEQLREHFTAGRLTEEEFSERVQAAYQARTGADLEALLADLPRLPASPAELRAERAERRRKVRRRAIEETSGSFGAFGVCTLIWVAAGAHGDFWPIWVAIAPVMALLRNGPRLLGMASGEDGDEEDGEHPTHTRARSEERRELRRERRQLRRGDRGDS
jgi:Domain of unknown function (DUF1707)